MENLLVARQLPRKGGALGGGPVVYADWEHMGEGSREVATVFHRSVMPGTWRMNTTRASLRV